MLRNIKALGLALVAVLAMSALVASAASAVEFHSTAEVTELVGAQVEGEHKFVTNTGVVVCKVAHFTGVVVGEEAGPEDYTSETVTIEPLYTECEFEELFEVGVSVNGCEYHFDVHEPEPKRKTGSVKLTGCNGSVPYIQVGSVFTCRVRVGEQEVSQVTFEVVGKNMKVIAEVTELSYTESGLFCAGEENVENGTYTGNTEVEGNGEEAELSIS